MHILLISPGAVQPCAQLPDHVPPGAYLWVGCSQPEFDQHLASLQALLLAVCGTALVDLHVSDLRNAQLPSRYDYTAHYDLLVFRRLASGQPAPGSPPVRGGPPALRRIDTAPVGFALFDQVLLTVHPQDCSVREAFASRLLAASGEQARGANAARLPPGPADLMLRMVSTLVDVYLDLRRELSRQLDHWQAELLSPKTRFNNWAALLQARLALHALEEISEDQRTAIQDWIGALAEWSPGSTEGEHRALDLLKVRSRDVLEHIERVVRHVRRLEQNIETTIQIHFNAQGNRTNDTMRTLTALTAVFLPLNLITGFFGMNFDYLPLVHRQGGLWWAVGIMAAVGLGFAAVLWRRRLLARAGR